MDHLGLLVLSVMSPGPNLAIVTSTTMAVSRRAGVLTGLGLALHGDPDR